MYTELFGVAFTFLIAILFLAVFRILTPDEILSGLGNEQVVVILMLLVWGDMMRKTAVIEKLFDRLFRNARSYNGFLTRMMVIVATFSSFLNNTPLVAIMMPYVHNWCKRNGYSPSRFLIPLSYAAILGGSVTLIGTSTNLIVAGMVEDQNIIPNLPELKMFDFVWVGIPMAILGYLYIILVGKRFLPDRHAVDINLGSSRTYFIEARVRSGSHLIGMRLDETNFLDQKGLLLVEIMRENITFPNYRTDLEFNEDDILVFAGDTQQIAELVEKGSGLVVPEIGMMSRRKKAEVIEIVVSQNSSLIGKELKEINFRAKYDAAVLSLHRNGENITNKIEDIDLRAGDVLLLYAGSAFTSRTQSSQDFYFISHVKDFVKIENYKVYILLGGLMVAIILATLGLVSLFISLLILLLTGMILGISSPKELPKSLDYNLALVIVLSLALGIAMIKTQAADFIASAFIALFQPFGKVGILFGIYLITTILAAYITNKASVGIIFPIALTIAYKMNLPPTPFILTVAYASAANFMTPHGYQTNLMVYGPGNYSFKDFFKIGTPLTMIYMITTVAILSLIYF
ncbi:MAG: SLC13 family permease [Bacteroidales bacterium]|nr:SLC13 family permease [Bacteroidales bacterium]